MVQNKNKNLIQSLCTGHHHTLDFNEWPPPFWYPLLVLKLLEKMLAVNRQVARVLQDSCEAQEWAIGSYLWYVWKVRMQETADQSFVFIPYKHVWALALELGVTCISAAPCPPMPAPSNIVKAWGPPTPSHVLPLAEICHVSSTDSAQPVPPAFLSGYIPVLCHALGLCVGTPHALCMLDLPPANFLFYFKSRFIVLTVKACYTSAECYIRYLCKFVHPSHHYSSLRDRWVHHMVGGQHTPWSCSLAHQVGSCLFAVGLGLQVISLSLHHFRRRLAGSGVTGRWQPHRVVGGLLRGDGWVRPHGRWSAYARQCSLARQVGSCLFAVGPGCKVTNLSPSRCRRCLAGLGVALWW